VCFVLLVLLFSFYEKSCKKQCLLNLALLTFSQAFGSNGYDRELFHVLAAKILVFLFRWGVRARETRKVFSRIFFFLKKIIYVNEKMDFI
jgi:hypothetical protein